MKRLLFVPVFAFVTALALAQETAPAPNAERMELFRRDRGLIEKLVAGGLQLAGEEDPLRRADFCTGVAEQLAAEIEQAAEGSENARAAEFGQHLRAMLQDGVAHNLTTARGRIPAGSAEEKRLFEVNERAAKVLGGLERRLQLHSVSLPAPPPDEMRHILKVVSDGRIEVEKAAKGK